METAGSKVKNDDERFAAKLFQSDRFSQSIDEAPRSGGVGLPEKRAEGIEIRPNANVGRWRSTGAPVNGKLEFISEGLQSDKNWKIKIGGSSERSKLCKISCRLWLFSRAIEHLYERRLRKDFVDTRFDSFAGKSDSLFVIVAQRESASQRFLTNPRNLFECIELNERFRNFGSGEQRIAPQFGQRCFNLFESG